MVGRGRQRRRGGRSALRMREAAGMRHARTRLRRRSSGGGCDGRYEKKYEKGYGKNMSRFLLLFAAETRFAGLLSHADEC